MTAPANTQVLNFADRVELVRDAVQKCVTAKQPVNVYAYQASLWCEWLRREVSL